MSEAVIEINGIETGVSNSFKAQIVERRPGRPCFGKVVYETPEVPNLILDRGLNRMATTYIVDLFKYCAIGTGSTPVEDPSGSIKATASGTTVVADTTFFSAADVGKLLRFATGERSKIVTFIDPYTVTVADALNVPSPTAFSLWRVNQVGLANEVKRNNGYLPGVEHCTTYVEGDVVVHKRTYEFLAETAPIQYSEVGFSESDSPGANLNSRGLFPGAPLSLVAGQQLRVIYFFRVRISPVVPVVKEAAISGWPSKQYTVTADPNTDRINLVAHGFPAGTKIHFGGNVPPAPLQFGIPYYVVNPATDSFQVALTPGGSPIDLSTTGSELWLVTNTQGQEVIWFRSYSTVASNGDSATTFPKAVLDPAFAGAPGIGGDAYISLGTFTGPLLTWPAPVSSSSIPASLYDIASKVFTSDSYIPDSFTRTVRVTFATNEANSSGIRSVCVRWRQNISSSGDALGVVFVFDFPQEKSNLYTLTVVFRWRWDREFF